MAEFRLNEITNEQILIVESRLKRPKDYKDKEVVEKISFKENCPFCVGNEEQTPPEVYRDGDPWDVRVVENKFPILGREGAITGYHYVVIETADHSKNLHEMSEDEIYKVVKSFIKVSEELYKKQDVKYVQIFKNYKKEAGASLEHPHSQIIAIKKMPEKIIKQKKKTREYFYQNGRCFICDIIKNEIQNKERIVYIDEQYIIYCPFASIFPYEMAIAPLIHKSSILNMNDEEIRKLGSIILNALNRLQRNVGDVAYNLFFDFIRDENEYYHFQIRICPRISIHAGFEIATGLHTNVISPETASLILKVDK
ncbi:DUF4931 domain-containing protein [Caloramator sp. ALD01]|nr:DUF4931 domain-containing protein [Caloramator sp. ALD01]